MNVNWKQIMKLAMCAVFITGVSAFCSVMGGVFIFIRTLDIHKESSAPGDFRETEPSIILTDILVNWGITFPFLCLIAWVGYEMTKGLVKEFSTPSNRRPVSIFLYSLFVFNLLLLFAGSIYCGIAYWQERAPYFPK